MTVPDRLNALEFLRKHLDGEGSSDLLADMIKTFAEALMDAEVDVLCNASRGERSPERVNSRNGHRTRDFDTRAGTIELAIPKLRHDSYFPDWLLAHRRRAEQALVSVVAQCYVEGVSTRRVDDVVKAMGLEGVSRSQVSNMAKILDERVAEFRSRPLDAGPYTYMWLDALFHKVREGGRVVSVATVIATGVNAEGHREILGTDIFTTEDGAGWTAFLRGLVARGLSGVALAVSDAHSGLVDAIAATLPGATWQRCRTHAMRNLLSKVPKAAQPMVATLVRSIFEQPDATQVRAQHARVVDQLTERFADTADALDQMGPDLLAFADFPVEHWSAIRSNNPQERLNKELRRRTDVVGIFPSRSSALRLIGAVLAEQHDEWSVGRRYMGADSLARARVRPLAGTTPETGSDAGEPALEATTAA
ncbi:MAG: IS256-like element IS1081 family transposase [Acidimicrobiales bacterium]